jgi:NADH-quinone oxidoreductase subunit E
MRTPPKPDANGRKFVKVFTILEKHGRKPSRLVPILQAVQEEYRYLPTEVLTYVATALDISPARVFGVATFYSHFAIQPKGKHLLRLCDGTACHVKDSLPILEALRKHLKLEGKKNTTDDMLFTVETVACLGACGLAPVLVVNDQIYGGMTPAGAVKLVEEIVAREQS